MDEACHMVAGMDTRSHIEQKLKAALSPIEIDVLDQSAEHAGHAGARSGGGHFRVLIVADAFEGLSPLQRQRRVYEILADEMKSAVHALSMTCLSRAEYESD
jgi:BolA family transcriptional regulator, general stress-responsive regulator